MITVWAAVTNTSNLLTILRMPRTFLKHQVQYCETYCQHSNYVQKHQQENQTNACTEVIDIQHIY